jgi:hypothetical protein
MTGTPAHILEAMLQPGLYPHPVGGVEHIQTHISHVFLAGDHAYKLKKPVDLGFLDFSTLEARRRGCLDELRLNRRLCPEIYLEVLAIQAGAGGVLELVPLERGGEPALDYCLKMRRMDQGRMMDGLLRQGGVTQEDILALAGVLADFHARAERGPAIAFHGRPEQVRINVEENFRQTEGCQEVCVAPARWQAVRDYSLGFLREQWGVLLERVERGRIVDGHGDLHSGNINLPPGGRPLVFDCIEFNTRFRQADAACDLAFLAMDLDFHGRGDLSRLLVDQYARLAGDQDALRLMDFYKCYRAVVRAKVYGFMFDDQEVPVGEKFTDLGRARAYWRLAASYAGNQPPFFLVCLMGLMGTGKSYLARALARATGWLFLNSDALRKQQAGLAPTQASPDAWGQGLYGAQAGRATYQGLMDGAQTMLAQGESIIVDASFGQASWRRAFGELAREQGARVLFVEVRAEREVVRKRLLERQAKGGSVSDGRLELMEAQAASWEDAGELLAAHGLVVDGGAELDAKLGPILARLKEMGHGD